MLDLKTMKSALEQLEQERKIPREKIIDAIEQALAAAYKKDYGKKGQIIRNKIDIETGEMEFYQVKIVVDESLVRMTKEDDEEEEIAEDDDRVRFNEEHHILLEDAKKIKSNVKLEEEMVPLIGKSEDLLKIYELRKLDKAIKDLIIHKMTWGGSMPNKAEFIKFNTIKAYINDILKMRSSESAVKKSMSEFDTAIETVLKEAGELAKQDKRNTVMDQDIISAVEKHLGKKNLTWQETAEEIIRQNPTDLGKISKAINDYIEKERRE